MTTDTSIKKEYKQTEIGLIPVDWEVYPLSQCTKRITDGEHLTPKRSASGFYLLSARNILNGRIDLSDVDYVEEDEYRRIIKRCNPEPGDVLISCSGTVGRVAIVPKELKCVMVRSAALVKPDPEMLSGLFVQYFLQSMVGQKQILASLNQGAQANLFQNHIRELRISIPPTKAEQEAIATILSDTDALIEHLEKLIVKKTAIKQGTMQQLLTGKMRLPGFSNELKPIYKQTEVGLIPEGWEVLSLGELATTVASGRSKAKSTYGTYPVHGSTGVIGYAESAEYEGNALLVARVGANAGKLTFVTGRYGVTDNTIIIRLKVGLWLPFFWQQLGIRRLNSLVFGSGQPLITGTQLKGLLLCVPPGDEQKAIATVLSDMDAEITKLEQKRDKTRALKQGMMQELLTGKTRLI